MKPAYRYLFMAALLLVGVAHLLTLHLQPLPWFDETYMASLSREMLLNGTLDRRIAWEAVARKQEYIYGPVFFWLSAGWMQIWGFGLWQYRLFVLLSGYTCLALAVAVYQKSAAANEQTAWWLAVFLSLDPLWFRAMHQGRMDFTALACLLGSWLLAHPRTWRRSIATPAIKWLASGGLFALAMLTTPRAGFSLPAFLLAIFFHQKNIHPQKKLVTLLLWLLPLLVLYPLWIAWAFGGMERFLALYLDQAPAFTKAGHRLFFIHKVQWPLFAVGIVALAAGVWGYGKRFIDFNLLMAVPWLLAFYTIVHDTGPYGVFTVFCFYLFIFRLWAGARGQALRQASSAWRS